MVNGLSDEKDEMEKLEKEKNKLKKEGNKLDNNKEDKLNRLKETLKNFFNSLKHEWEICLDVDERKCLENKLVKISTLKFNELMTKLYEIKWN